MTDWWTYRLSDFALFSERVYYRLLELHNAALWPAHVPVLALGAIALLLLARRPAAAGKVVPAILAAVWLWLAWAFFWRSYATINWAAAYAAPAAALQGLLLLWLGALRGSIRFGAADGTLRMAALAIFAGSALLYPLLAPAAGRSWRSAELFGIAPDPTALGTLAALALSSGPARWAASILPALWCAISGATLWAIGAEWPWVPPAAAAACLVLFVCQTGRRSGDRSRLQSHASADTNG
jgi:hypothetical protein